MKICSTKFRPQLMSSSMSLGLMGNRWTFMSKENFHSSWVFQGWKCSWAHSSSKSLMSL